MEYEMVKAKPPCFQDLSELNWQCSLHDPETADWNTVYAGNTVDKH